MTVANSAPRVTQRPQSFRHAAALAVTLVCISGANAVTLPGGGSKRTDCVAQLATTGEGFPFGRELPIGSTCTDGDPSCDQDGQSNGVCEFSASVCINTHDAALRRCKATDVGRIRVTGTLGLRGRVRADLHALQTATEALDLPTATPRCTVPVDLGVPVTGPDERGEFHRGLLDVRLNATTSRGSVDRDRFLLVCLPRFSPTRVTTTTTTTTLPPPPPPTGTPGAGLKATIVGAAVNAGGRVQVTFRLTDDADVPVTPTLGVTDGPSQARTLFTIARLEVNIETSRGFSTDFTRYQNYITATQTSPITGDSSQQPTYDSGGTLTPTDPALGTWTYTFGTLLPAGFPSSLTHTVGAEIERTFAGRQLVANPVFDFVPAGGPVTTVREVTTTDQCNVCHGQLAAHGGRRREVRLCQLCHTDQAIDPDTGNSIDFKVMAHKIHRGKQLPSLQGTLGAKYGIIGFGQVESIFGEHVKACSDGARASATCTTDADCPGGTCGTEKMIGVGFPQDIRDCEKCHDEGATAANHKERPSAAACASCHDDANPGETALFTSDPVVPNNMLAPGTKHVAAAQPDALCRVCHTSEGDEFGISVEGAHTIPLRSTTLAGLQGQLLNVSGAAGGPVTVGFRITNGAGTPLDVTSGFDLVAFTIGGPSSDLTSDFEDVAVGDGAGGTLTYNGDGTFTYVTSDPLPDDAAGTWRVGLEASRPVMVNGHTEEEAVPNPVRDFSVDGTPVAPRRTVVSVLNCASCHGTFSKDFSVHGNARNQTEYCVLCHNVSETDFPGRSLMPGADPADEPIDFKHMIHRIHTGVEQERQPYIIYGFDNLPVDFSDVEYPGDRRNCAACHVNGSQLLPLPAGALATPLTTVDTSMGAAVETRTGSIPPIQDACLSCHDSLAAKAHADGQTTTSGAEACVVCHGEGRIEAVSQAHATGP